MIVRNEEKTPTRPTTPVKPARLSHFFSKKQSAPDITHTKKNSLPTPRSSSSDLLMKTKSVSADAFISDLYQKPSLPSCDQIYFTGTAQQSVRIKGSGYLRVNEGDSVRIYLTERPSRGVFDNVVCDTERGRLLTNSIDLNIHTCNLYLEAIDLLVKHPNWLTSLLTGVFENYPDRDQVLIKLLRARKLIPAALEGLLDIEFSRAQHKDKNVALRHESPAMIVILTALKSNSAVTDYCNTIIHSIKASIKSRANNHGLSTDLLQNIIKTCLENIDEIAIPSELGMILKSIKKIADRYFTESARNSLIGSIFFLRLICPKIISEAMRDKPDTMMSKNTIILAKALQLISNQVDPGSNDEIIYQSTERLKDFHHPTASMLSRMADTAITDEVYPVPVIEEAASFYGFMLEKLSSDNSNDESLIQLKERLGDVYLHAETDELSIPMMDTISKISDYINDSLQVCLKLR